MDDELLFKLADDAFVVLNWAKREGHKKPVQLEQCVEAFKKTISEHNLSTEEVVPSIWG